MKQYTLKVNEYDLMAIREGLRDYYRNLPKSPNSPIAKRIKESANDLSTLAKEILIKSH